MTRGTAVQWETVRLLRDRAAATCPAGTLISGFGSSAMQLGAGIRVKTLTGSNSLAASAGFRVTG